ncbi:hypothetical protein KUCAC02_036009 [Chaenocephalus aceratus]|nr:hypothetical protein KUCAC02_036009 [Chaenocephalus aceratus]
MGQWDLSAAVPMTASQKLLSTLEPCLWTGDMQLAEPYEDTLWFKFVKRVRGTYIWEEYVSEHWKDDDFFGYQFLNGINPFIIQRCSKLPSNFPLTEEMVQPFLAIGSSLNAEMKKGNIFLSDYKIMEGLATKVIDGKPTVVTPALCLLYLNPQKKLLPIAIQLSQQPSEENPIFLPTDSESDWMLAKMFVRSADALHHLLVSHFLRTHLLPEVFTMATLRNLPKNHPLHKLLTPHHRFTIPINIFARETLFGPGQFFSKSSLDKEGQLELMRRGLSRTTYSSLCLPENIAARGLESIPNFHFRDDALRLWSIINSFIQSMVAYYYPSDSEVSADSELQEWINEIFYHGFLGNYDSGFPSSLQTVEELIQVVTTVVFTSSASHSAGNRGQYPQVTMAEYKLEMTTGAMQYAGTSDYMYVTLFGTEEQSERTLMDNYGVDFQRGATGSYTVKTSLSLGKLLLVKVEKDKYLCLPEDEWYFSKMVVTTPEGDVILYPCYRWIGRGEIVELRGGRAMKAFEEDHPLLIDHRKNELMLKKSLFEWKIMAEGIPHVSNFNDVSELPAEIRFSDSRIADINYSRAMTGIELKVKGLLGSTAEWESIEDIKKIFWYKKTTMSGMFFLSHLLVVSVTHPIYVMVS